MRHSNTCPHVEPAESPLSLAAATSLSAANALPPGGRFAVLESLRYARNPHRYSRTCVERYGDPFTVPLLMGNIVVTATPEGVAELFATSPDHFAAWGVEELGPLLGEFSVIQTSGARHLRDRRLLTPCLHGKQLDVASAVMRDAAERRVRTWKTGQRIDVHDFAQDVSIDIILATIFGIREPDAQRVWRDAVARYVTAIEPGFLFVKPLRREVFGLSAWARFLRAGRALDALIEDELSRRRDSPAGDDLLSALLVPRDGGACPSTRAVRDQLIGLLFAGHETTAVALTWALYELHRAPKTLQRLRTELDELAADCSPKDLANAPYLSAVCKETLRLHPVAPDIARKLVKPLRIFGRDLPAGVGVGACISLAHQNPSLYPDPTSFRPERFLERRFGPAEYFPFGGGRRRCLGAAFATRELAVVIAEVLRSGEFELRTRGRVRAVRRSVTTGPDRAVVLRKL